MDFTTFYEPQMLLGEISELFSGPVIPKMVIVGLIEGNDENLRLFKEILTKALDNLFVIEFCEQFIPENKRLSSNQVHYRNHEVKETWLYKMRQERPAILIDFRLMSQYHFNEDDSFLCDQLYQTKCSLPEDGPIYLVWLAGKGLSSQRVAAISKQAKLEKSVISVLELWDDATMITVSLKERIHECFEGSKTFYQNQGRKYKKSASKTSKFVQPWMSTVYYYFKLAVLEEFRGDFQSALKYYHTILAKFKELIEAATTTTSDEERYQMINYLRRSADICFIRLSFLLFRLKLNQCGEAEFGLFRYLNYFSHGLNQNDQIIWRYNMSRTFAKQLINSSVWLKENELIMRGAAHFLIYALKIIRNYSSEEFYQIQEMKMRDLSDALESALKSPKLSHFVDYLQFLIIDEYFCQSLEVESGPFINYLKESYKIKGWELIEEELLKKSIILAKSQQDYNTAVQDSWRLRLQMDKSKNTSKFSNTSNNSNNSNNNDNTYIEDWCLIHAQMYQEPIRINFSSSNLINCNLKFDKKKCEIFEECQVELNIYIKKNCGFEFELESIGIFFDNEQIEPIIFSSVQVSPKISNDTSITKNCTLIPGKILKLKKSFIPTRMGKLKLSFVTMQLKRPFLALQFDDSAFLHQQNSEKFNEESLEFVRICQKAQKSNLSLRVEAQRPRISFEIMANSLELAYTEASISVTVTNLMEQAIKTEFEHFDEKYEIDLGPKEVQTLSLKHKTTEKEERVKIKTRTRFNLELIELKYTENFNFDIFEEEFQSNLIKSVNPFKISSKLKGDLVIKARFPIEFLAITSVTCPFAMKPGERKTFTIKSEESIEVKFRLLQDESNQIFQHQYSLK